jgi:hypothetical protein
MIEPCARYKPNAVSDIRCILNEDAGQRLTACSRALLSRCVGGECILLSERSFRKGDVGAGCNFMPSRDELSPLQKQSA